MWQYVYQSTRMVPLNQKKVIKAPRTPWKNFWRAKTRQNLGFFPIFSRKSGILTPKKRKKWKKKFFHPKVHNDHNDLQLAKKVIWVGTRKSLIRVKDHKCNQYIHLATSTSDLDKHKKGVHEKVNDRKCNQCSYSTGQKDSMNKYQLDVHEKIRDRKCHQCG